MRPSNPGQPSVRPDPGGAVAGSVDQVIRLEEELSSQRSLGEQVGNVVGNFAGTLKFVGLHIGAVAAWCAVNGGLVPGVRPFDPFPYSLLGATLSLEGVLLAAFVLAKQRHEARLSERRSHLNLQATLLVEREVTELLRLLHPAAKEGGGQGESAAGGLLAQTEVGDLADALEDRAERSEAPLAGKAG